MMKADHDESSPHLLGYSLLLGAEGVQSEHSGVKVNKRARHVHGAETEGNSDDTWGQNNGQDSPEAGHVIRAVVTAQVTAPGDGV